MQSFKQFLEKEGIDYFVVEISDNKLIDKLSLLNEGDWVQSGKKDWMIRVDSPKPEIKQQRHVHVARERHVKNKNMQASWNQDRSKHDKKTYNSKIGSLDVVQSIAKQALGLPANAKLEEAAKASRLLFLLNESENELGIKPVLFILRNFCKSPRSDRLGRPHTGEDDDERATDAGTGFEKYSKTTRREKFLTEMDRIVPWGELCALIAPVYPKAGAAGWRRLDR